MAMRPPDRGRADAETTPARQRTGNLLQNPAATTHVSTSPGIRPEVGATGPPHDRTGPRRKGTGSKVDAAGGQASTASVSDLAHIPPSRHPEWHCRICGRDLRLLPYITIGAGRIRCKRCPDLLDGAT